MSTTPTPTPTTPAPVGSAAPEAAAPVASTAEPAPVETPAQESTDWKAEARKWEQRAKENTAAAARLAEIEEASQKQAEQLAAAQARIAEFEQAAQVASWIQEVAEAAGVPASALRGSTKEEIEAHAETLKALIGRQQETPVVNEPVPTIGKVPSATPNVPIGEQIAVALKSGDTALAEQLKALQLSAAT